MITQIKDKIIQIKEKIIQIQGEQKRKFLIIAVSGIILLAVDIFFVFMPLINRTFYLKSQIISIKENTAYLNRQISMLDTTKKRLGALKTDQIKYREFFPKEEEVPVLLGNLSSIAGKLGVDIIAVKPVKSGLGRDAEKTTGLFHEVPIEISAKGGYHQMGQFINKLETLNNFMEIKDLEIITDKATPRRHFFRLLVSTYILKT